MARPSPLSRPGPAMHLGLGTNTLTVSDITDIDLTGIADGDIIIWDDATDTWVVGPQTGGGGTVDIEDEGTPEGAADTIDFVGSGVSVSFAGGTATVTIPGGGGSLPVFYVNDYGAVGDNTTDDTTAIQDAIDAAAAAGGGLVLFGGFSYMITATLTTSDPHIHLVGVGNEYGPTIIRMDTADTTAISFPSSWPDATRTYQGSIRNLQVLGPGGASSGRGIYAKSNINLDNVGIVGFYDGLYWDDVTFYSRARGCFISDCDHAAVVMNQTNNCTLDTCRITGDPLPGPVIGPVPYGVIMSSTSPRGINNRIVNCSIEYFTATGVYIDGGYSVIITGSYFESQQSSSGNAHIKVGPGGSNVCYSTLIQGNWLQGDGTSGFNAIDLGRCENVTISDNTFGYNSAIGITSTSDSHDVLLWNNYNNPAGTFSLPSDSYELDPNNPPLSVGDAAGGDLSGTYPNPTVVDDSHNHSTTTAPGGGMGPLMLSSDHGVPIVFGDIIQASDGSDFVYASEP